MSTKINLEHKFSKGVDSVWKMYSDRAFFERHLGELTAFVPVPAGFAARGGGVAVIEVPAAIDTQDSQTPHGVRVGPLTQLSERARIFAIEVLPVPREPTNR